MTLEAATAYRAAIALGAACLAACIAMGAALCLAPPVGAGVAAHLCAMVLLGAVVGFPAIFMKRPDDSRAALAAEPAEPPERFHMAAPIVCAAAGGIALFALFSGALEAIWDTPGFPALLAYPAGLALSGAAFLLWLNWLAGAYVEDRSRSYLAEARENMAGRRNPLKVDFEPEAPRHGMRSLLTRGCACAVLFGIGAAVCLSAPLRAMPAAVEGLLCAGACLAVCAAYAALAAWSLRHGAGVLDERLREIDRKLDMARAEQATAEAERMTAEATRALKNASKKASRSGVSPSLESACILAGNKFGLSERELDVLVILASGRTRPRIAEDLRVTLSTVNSHIQKIYRKMGVHSNQELIDLLEGLR